MNLIPDRKIESGQPTRGRKPKKTTLRLRTLDNMRDALALAIVDDADDNRNWRGRSSTAGSLSFTATESADEYLTMLRDGWQAGIDGVSPRV